MSSLGNAEFARQIREATKNSLIKSKYILYKWYACSLKSEKKQSGILGLIAWLQKGGYAFALKCQILGLDILKKQ
jgi:hypothetical protein